MGVDPDLIRALEECSVSAEKKGRVRKNVFSVLDHDELQITGWKFNDWDYLSGGLPTNARGLFTAGDAVVLRGYDKFFSIDEVRATRWESILAHTTQPYHVTVKENGCLVLIAGYQGKLVVTSKHSSGLRADGAKNHAFVAKQWVLKHLKQAGQTEQSFASELERLGVTAVGELCDDAFEEHVLPYAEERAGIYLTGVNYNCSKFATWPPDQVLALATRYGFKHTHFVTFHDVHKLKEFLEECAETGTWKGESVEGFVVRCQRQSEGADPTYEDFFFKYKFEEPYLMYRKWREVTKEYLTGSLRPLVTGKHRETSARYLKFLAQYLPQHPELAQCVLVGTGIIELRQRFLETAGMTEQELLALGLTSLPVKYVLVPVATIGAGKTTVSVALAELLRWGHVQNDDMRGKKKKELLVEKSIAALDNAEGVIMDRCNHKKDERAQIIKDMSEAADVRGYQLKFVCLNFYPTGPSQETWKITHGRVVRRGENHQTIRDMDQKMIVGIMKGFEGRYQPVSVSTEPDASFDLVIDLNVSLSVDSAQNVRTVLRALHKKYSLDTLRPDSEVSQAVARALSYKPDLSFENTNQSSKSKRPPLIYFGARIDAKLVSLLDKQFGDIQPELWKKMKDGKDASVQKEFHVTLAHRSANRDAFTRLKGQFSKTLLKASQDPEDHIIELPAVTNVTVTHICFNEKIIALRVHSDPYTSANEHPHITIGALSDVRPVEANEMLKTEHTDIPWSIEPQVFTDMPLFAYR